MSRARPLGETLVASVRGGSGSTGFAHENTRRHPTNERPQRGAKYVPLFLVVILLDLTALRQHARPSAPLGSWGAPPHGARFAAAAPGRHGELAGASASGCACTARGWPRQGRRSAIWMGPTVRCKLVTDFCGDHPLAVSGEPARPPARTCLIQADTSARVIHRVSDV